MNILIVGRRRLLAETLSKQLSQHGCPARVLDCDTQYPQRNKPRLLLLELEAGHEQTALKTLRSMAARFPDTPVLILADHFAIPELGEFLQAGVSGFASTSWSFKRLRNTIQHFLADDTAGQSERPLLTPRQTAVLRLLGQGQTNKAIARQLAITERTVKAHVSSIMENLGACTRTEAVLAAGREGLLRLN